MLPRETLDTGRLATYLELTGTPFPVWESILAHWPQHLAVYAYLDSELQKRGYGELAGVSYFNWEAFDAIVARKTPGQPDSDRVVIRIANRLGTVGLRIQLSFSVHTFTGRETTRTEAVDYTFSSGKDAVDWFLINLK